MSDALAPDASIPPETQAAAQPYPVKPNAAQSHAAQTHAAQAFAESAAIMARLRGPGGCPWDREQSFDSIRKHTLEETYEVLDAIERRDWANLKEELGDLVLQVLFYAQMASELKPEEGGFTIAEVLDGLNRKLIRRHPHVFGEEASAAAGNVAPANSVIPVEGESSEAAAKVLRNWEQIKAAEKLQAAEKRATANSPTESLLDGVMRAQPALAEAGKLGSKAAKVGFDWPEWSGLLAKVEEETGELVEAIETGKQEAIEAELGDLLFTVVNLGRHLHVDAEMALRGTNLRFRQRFQAMEQISEKPLRDLGPEDLEALWVQAKASLHNSNKPSTIAEADSPATL